MNTIQIIAAETAFVSVVAAIITGAWINQRAIERQMDAFRNEIKAEMGAFKSEIRAELATVIAPLAADVAQVKQGVEKIDRQFEAVFNKLIFPGKGD